MPSVLCSPLSLRELRELPENDLIPLPSVGSCPHGAWDQGSAIISLAQMGSASLWLKSPPPGAGYTGQYLFIKNAVVCGGMGMKFILYLCPIGGESPLL